MNIIAFDVARYAQMVTWCPVFWRNIGKIIDFATFGYQSLWNGSFNVGRFGLVPTSGGKTPLTQEVSFPCEGFGELFLDFPVLW